MADAENTRQFSQENVRQIMQDRRVRELLALDPDRRTETLAYFLARTAQMGIQLYKILQTRQTGAPLTVDAQEVVEILEKRILQEFRDAFGKPLFEGPTNTEVNGDIHG